MILVWILLWLLALITITKDYKTESTRWVSAIAFFTGLGAFSVILQENFSMFFIENCSGSQKIEITSLLYFINAILVCRGTDV